MNSLAKARTPSARASTTPMADGSVTNQQVSKTPVRGTIGASTNGAAPEAPMVPQSPTTDPINKTVRYSSTVHVRLTWELPVPVKNPKGCTIAYRFTTQPSDISFGLFFRDVNGNESTLVSYCGL